MTAPRTARRIGVSPSAACTVAMPHIGLGVRACCSTADSAATKAFHQRLIDAGKPKLVALVAVARKLLTILNAIIRSGKAWKSEVQAASI